MSRKQIQKNLRHGFVEEDNNAKINVYPNIPCTFLLFKASSNFLSKKFTFPTSFENFSFLEVFDIPLPMYFFTKEHPLKPSNKRTHIPLLINQFYTLIELKM